MKINKKLHSVALVSAALILFLIFVSFAASARYILKLGLPPMDQQTVPAINGDKIVWQDDRNGNRDIYMYDLSTKKETRSPPMDQISTRLQSTDNRVVWTGGMLTLSMLVEGTVFTYKISPLKSKF